MLTIKEIQDIVNAEILKLDFSLEPVELYQPVAYTLSMGGKRLRPVLCLLATDMFGGDIKMAIKPALGIEIFHNFTLVHDDIMDNAPIRRGQATVYKKWNTNIALLSGDTMFAKAYELVAESEPPILQRILQVFTQTAIEVCEGQQYDMNFETRNNVTLDEYKMMIRLKTAVLIAASLKVGALVAGCIKEDADNMYRFGENLGMIFQLQDDLLDLYSDEAVFGKLSGGDIASNKKTYLYIKAIEIANNTQRKKLMDLYASFTDDSIEKINEVKNIFDALNIKDAVTEEMKVYYTKAIEYLLKVNVKDTSKKQIREFTDALMERNY